MKTHVGVDLHQRFCYLTAVDASGKLVRQGQVVNEAAALRGWLGSLSGPRQVVVEASGFWPAFARAVRPEAERVVMVHPQRKLGDRRETRGQTGRSRSDRSVTQSRHVEPNSAALPR